MNPIQAIPTTYRGIVFRSRIEARWAVFFDKLGIQYEYEKEGYTLPPIPGAEDQRTLHYLPDFFIPAQRKFTKPLWAEVKGADMTDAWEKISRLCVATQIHGTILRDIPNIDPAHVSAPGAYGFYDADLTEHEYPLVPTFYGAEDLGYSFCECPFCGAFGWEFNGRSARIGCGCKQHAEIANGDKTYNDGSPALLAAYQAAKRERFGT